jgi:CXXX repeat modification system protein
MIAADAAGNFYPCVRFLGFSLANKPAFMMGNIYDGFDLEISQRLVGITRSSISPKECMDCEVASGCAWCPGFNYDDDENAVDGIGKRAIHICKMHKARVRANDRYQKKLKEIQELDKSAPVICKDGKCALPGKTVGKITREESNQIKQLFLRREALADLFSLLPEMEEEIDGLYEQILEDTGKTVQEYDSWWAKIAKKYGWETGKNLQVNFDSCTVSKR